MIFDINDNNSTYLGDGAYGHVDKYGRLWVIAYNGIDVTEQVCLEFNAIESLLGLRNRVNSENSYIVNDNDAADE